MQVNYIPVVSWGFLSGLALVFLLNRLAARYNLLISQGVSLVGGLGIGLSFLIISSLWFFIWGNLPKEAIGILVSSLIMLVFGAIDDLWELSVIAKFLAQIISVIVLISLGVKAQIVFIGSVANIIITAVWVIGIANAFNHLDVADGLAASIALTIGLSLFAISFLNGDIMTEIFSLVICGALFSFLIYNLPPARVYMGNAGSHFLGFVLAAIALVISYAPLERKVALISPLLIFGLPIFDTVFLIFIRIGKKKLPFKKSNDHIALRLLALGYSKKKTLAIMFFWGIFFALSGVLVSRVSNPWGAMIIGIAVLGGLVLAKKIAKVTVD